MRGDVRRLRRLVLSALVAGLALSGLLVGLVVAAPSQDDLPDLVTLLPSNHGNVNDRWVDTHEIGGRTLYRFDTVIRNDGGGALEVYRNAAGDTFQRVWTGGDPNGTGSPTSFPAGAPSFEDLPLALGRRGEQHALSYSAATGHNHFHTKRVASYQLFTTGGQPVAEAAKNLAGFCLYDSWGPPSSGTPARYPGDYGGGVRPCGAGQSAYDGLLRMGIQSGWGDFYASQLYDQWVDVTGVAPGGYRLRATADPADLYLESDDSNNQAEATVTIPGALAAPVQATTAAGTAVSIPLSGTVVGASVKSRINATCDISQASCMTAASATQLGFAIAQPPAAGVGTATIQGSQMVFTPASGFTGTATIGYRAIDSRGLSGPTATATVTVSGAPAAVTVDVTPASASVQVGAQQQFAAALSGSTATPVWSVNGIQGGNATVGTISAAGLYTAPAQVPAGGTVTVRATEAASGAADSATVTVTAAPSGPAPRDPNLLPLVDDLDGPDLGPPPGPAWASGPIWSGQRPWKRIANTAGPSATGWTDAHLIAGSSRPVGIRFQLTTPPPAGSVVFAWLVSSGIGSRPSGYALRMSRGASSDGFQLQRWSAGAATFLAGRTTAPLPAGGWLALMADAAGVEAFTSTNGTTWTSVGTSPDTSLGGPMQGGVETNAATTRIDNVRFGRPLG